MYDDDIHDMLHAASQHLHIRSSLLADVRRAAAHRRRRRYGFVAIGVALATALASLTVTASQPATSTESTPPTSCDVQRLSIPDGLGSSVVTGADQSGHFMTGYAYDADESQPTLLLWTDGKPELVDLPGANPSLADVNGSGVVIGNTTDGDLRMAWTWRDGTATRLTTAEGLPGRFDDSATAIAIGDDGTIAGERPYRGTEITTGVVWRGGPNGEDLDGSGSPTHPTDVDASGNVLGTKYSPATSTLNVLWMADGSAPPAHFGDLFLPGHPTQPWATSIDDNVIMGATTSRDGPGIEELNPPAFMDIVTGRFTVLSGEPDPPLINRLGWRAGRTVRGLELITSTAHVSLPELDGPGDSTAVADTLVRTISSDGRTLGGQVVDASGRPQAVVWHCS